MDYFEEQRQFVLLGGSVSGEYRNGAGNGEEKGKDGEGGIWTERKYLLELFLLLLVLR